MDAENPFPAERTAVITGAASARGIGRATADRLARDGWSIAILDLDGEAAKRTAAEIGGDRSVASLGVAADIADPDSVEAAIAQVEASLPPIIGLANVAGVSSPVDFLDLTLAEWDRVFDINMRGAFLVTRRVVPAMLAAGVGRIVSVSSVSAPARRRDLLQGALQCLQGGAHRLQPGAGPRARSARDHGELRRAGADRHRHHGWDPDPGAQGRAGRRQHDRPGGHGG
jgi:NAD(P)-dependent dehydrogenase (short-subunit alcohol dehydrogenase family)